MDDEIDRLHVKLVNKIKEFMRQFFLFEDPKHQVSFSVDLAWGEASNYDKNHD